MMFLNLPLHLCSSKPHKYDNYDKAPYIAPSYPRPDKPLS